MVSFCFLLFPRLFSDWRLDVYYTSIDDVVSVRIKNAGLKCAARGSLKIQDAKIRYYAHNFVALCLRN